ncbi:tetraspanin-32 isoform X3 [Sciurus carolinensis]|uniref:tetraspanin-32 isoform X3 n=1 Tax=Sciurus carolinensis TaxID=30640 RepID=UPI001FB207CE|nr:tetraspanin-32 isoform X3 [Sciurus carolinensis]
MGPGRRVRVAKCQMLLTCFLVLLLSLSVATLAVRAHFGDHFAVVSQASLERNPCEAMSHWVFYTGISLAGLLSLGAALSAAATTREAQGPLAMGFLCFALVFCSLVQVAFWRFHNPTQVEDAMLDTFDLVYHQAVRSPSRIRAQELAAIQDTDCLQSIRSFLKTQQNIASMLTSAGLALTGYAMLLSSFLWAAVRSGRGLDRRGKYTLTPRACGCQAQELSRFTHSQGGPAPRHPSEAETLAGHQGPRGCLDEPHPLQG